MKRFKRVLRAARRSLGGAGRINERKLGDERRAAGDWAMAARHYRAHVTSHPGDFDIWVQLGHAFKEAGRLVDADTAYQSAESLRPDDADLLLCRGHLAKLRKDQESAAELYARSFAIDANPAAARELGQISAQHAEITYTEVIGLVGALDGFADGMVGGWAIEPHAPEIPAEVEILVEGRVVATGVCNIDRPDILAAGLVRRRATGFQIDLSGVLDLARPTELHARLAGSRLPLADSPRIVEISDACRNWSRRWKRLTPDVLRPLISRIDAEAPRTTLGVIIAVTGDGGRLGDLVESLQQQWCGRWETVLFREDGTDLKLPRALEPRIAADARFRVLAAAGSGSGNALVRALGAASTAHVAFLSQDSVLEPEAVWRILDAAQRGGDLIYWDEARTGPSAESVERFVLRPAFSIDHFKAFPDLIGSFALRRETAVALAASRGAPAFGTMEWLKTTSVGKVSTAAHVPTVLERRRSHIDGDREPKPAGVRKPDRANAAIGERTLVVLSPRLEAPTLRPTIQAILASTDMANTDLVVVSRANRTATTQRYFDRLEGAARIWTCDDDSAEGQAINDAVAAHGSAYPNLVLVDAPIAPSGAWLDAIVNIAARPDVGVAAPILVSADGRVLSAGIGLMPQGLVHSHRDFPFMTRRDRSPGWNRSLVSLREQSAAAGCLAIRTEIFVGVGGLDPIMSADLAFADLCLRVAKSGRKILIDPRIPVRATRGPSVVTFDAPFRARWASWIAGGDPFLIPVATDGAPGLDTVFTPATIRAINPRVLPLAAGRLPVLSAPPEPSLVVRIKS